MLFLPRVKDKLPPLPLEVGPLNTARGFEGALCILESKSAALVAAVFVDFPKNRCYFLHKIKLDIARLVQFLTGRRPTRSFSAGAVATIALWKSAAPMLSADVVSRTRSCVGVQIQLFRSDSDVHRVGAVQTRSSAESDGGHWRDAVDCDNGHSHRLRTTAGQPFA